MSRKMIEGRLILCGIEPVKSLELKSRTSSFGKWNSEKGSESLRKLWERLRVLSWSKLPIDSTSSPVSLRFGSSNFVTLPESTESFTRPREEEGLQVMPNQLQQSGDDELVGPQPWMGNCKPLMKPCNAFKSSWLHARFCDCRAWARNNKNPRTRKRTHKSWTPIAVKEREESCTGMEDRLKRARKGVNDDTKSQCSHWKKWRWVKHPFFLWRRKEQIERREAKMGLFLFGISIEETFKRKKGKVELSDGEMRDGGLLTSSYKHRCGRLSPSLVQLLHTLHLFYV